MSAPAGGKSSSALYRDCLRLIRHMAGESPKAAQLRTLVASEFRKNASVSNPEQVSALKFAAVRALSNYLLLESSQRDTQFKEKMKKQSRS